MKIKLLAAVGLAAAMLLCPGCSGARKADNANKVVVYTPFPDATAIELKDAFEKKTGIKVEQILEGTTKVFARIRVEKRNPRADIWYGGGGMLPFMKAAKEDLLEPYIPGPYKGMPVSKGNMILRDKNWLWSPIGIISLGFCYNPQVLSPDEVPKTWEDLTDPKWHGGIEMWDPAESGTSMLFLDSAILRYMKPDGDESAGWDFLTAIFKNLRRYTREGKPAFSVTRGETRIGIHFEHQYLEFLDQQSGNTQLNDAAKNIKWYLPPESPVIADGIALIKGAPHPGQAKAFYDFCVSREGQRIVNKYFFSVYPDLPPPEHLDGITLDTLMERAAKLDAEWMADNYDRIRKKWQNDVESTADDE